MAWITKAMRCASEVVGVMRVKLGLVTPACFSKARAFSMSRLGMGMFLA